MIFLTGPRQVGKTTLALQLGNHRPFTHLNWDNSAHRRLILSGPEAVAHHAKLEQLHSQLPLLAFDEIHKHTRWKDFLKGFFDTYGDRCRIVVTGSAQLGTLAKGGDSLMGRYFSYRVHPLSLGELARGTLPDDDLHSMHLPGLPHIDASYMETLLQHGGFPEPFVKKNIRFRNRWQQLRDEQLFREDIRDLTRVQELDRMQLFAQLLQQQIGQLTSFSSLAVKVGASVDTLRRWVNILQGFYLFFALQPWSANVARSLIKQPKYYMWDWSCVQPHGAQLENCIASHLLKTAHIYTDLGLGKHSLHFVRDKQKREVDFLMCSQGKPWFLVEVKHSSRAPLSASLAYFQKQLNCPHAFQVVFDLPFVAQDCFAQHRPVIVPAQSLLSQLV
ncbi:MAG: AAA family ATPase [Myxococcota bacterium]